MDAFFAGDSAEAKARVAEFLESLDLRALDAGALEMAHALEWAGILLVGLAGNGAGFRFAGKRAVRSDAADSLDLPCDLPPDAQEELELDLPKHPYPNW